MQLNKYPELICLVKQTNILNDKPSMAAMRLQVKLKLCFIFPKKTLEAE